MRLTLTRVGGFAGITKPPLVAETGALALPDSQRIRDLVAEADFFGLPSELVADRVDPDSFGYTLTIVADSGEEHSVAFTDRSLQGSLRDLVSMLRGLANRPASG